MPNDAKLGLVVGVGLVIAVAVLFFRKDMPTVNPAAAANATPSPTLPVTTPGRTRPVSAQSGIRSGHTPASAEGRCHTVQEGETLFSLAQRYYGDRDKFDLIYRSNRARLHGQDTLEPGTVLVIPEEPDNETAP